jgi:hypothetical protein
LEILKYQFNPGILSVIGEVLLKTIHLNLVRFEEKWGGLKKNLYFQLHTAFFQACYITWSLLSPDQKRRKEDDSVHLHDIEGTGMHMYSLHT